MKKQIAEETSSLLQNIREQLRDASDEKNRISGQRYFKEQVRLYGVKAAEVRLIAIEGYAQVKGESKAQIFALCEELWQSGFMEESFIACHWSYAIRKQYERGDFSVFEKWVGLYVNNWASCDTLCNHNIGTLVETYPEFLANLKEWTSSENRWVRRAAAVSLIVPARRGKFLNDIFELALLLLTDGDDMVQKGYGWMLKEASRTAREPVFEFVMSHKEAMPRTALRYAIEKMPPDMRARALAKS